jgi:hypothetical protein
MSLESFIHRRHPSPLGEGAGDKGETQMQKKRPPDHVAGGLLDSLRTIPTTTGRGQNRGNKKPRAKQCPWPRRKLALDCWSNSKRCYGRSAEGTANRGPTTDPVVVFAMPATLSSRTRSGSVRVCVGGYYYR